MRYAKEEAQIVVRLVCADVYLSLRESHHMGCEPVLGEHHCYCSAQL